MSDIIFDKEVQITEHLFSDKESIERVFSDYIDDAEDMTDKQFDECIKYSQERGWENWEKAWKDWKEQGEIPFYEI